MQVFDLPARLGPYILGKPLGRGGMGVVVGGHDPRLQRNVAIKILIASGEEDSVRHRRFLREMRAQASLSHPNIVKIFDVGTDKGFQYLVMERLTGSTLRQRIDTRGALSPERVVAMGIALAEALVAVHAAGMIHRDIKPQNIFLDPQGQPILMDLGLVRSAGDTAVTEVGSLVGTPRYIAPEALLGAPIDQRSDIYQLGLALYEAATGTLPFEGSGFHELVPEIVGGRLRTPAALNPAIDPRLDAAIRWMVNARPEGRARSAQDVVARLESLGRRRSERQPDPLARTGTDTPTPATPDRATIAPSASRESTAKLRKAAGTIAVVLGSLAGIAIARHARVEGPEIAPATSPATLAADPAKRPAGLGRPAQVPSVDPGAGGELGLTGQWRSFTAEIPALHRGGEESRLAVEALRARSRIDFGSVPDAWLQWFELCRRLNWEGNASMTVPPSAPAAEEALGTPGPARAHRADELSAGALTAAAIAEHLRPLDDDLTPQVIRDIVRLIALFPDEGSPYLALGWALELDGQSREALAAYREGLDRLGTAVIPTESEWVWRGFARALMRVPGHQLEHELAAHSKARRMGIHQFDALRDALAFSGGDTSMYRRLLEQESHDPEQVDMTSYLTGEMKLHPGAGEPSDPDGALAIWTAGLSRTPGGWFLSQAMVTVHLEQGDLRAAQADLPSAPVDLGWKALLDCLSDRASTDIKVGTIRGWGIGRGRGNSYAPLRLLELGRVKEAIEQVRIAHVSFQWRHSVPTLALEMIAAGDTDAYWTSVAETYLLSHDLEWRPWWIAAGALVTEHGVPVMQQLLARRRAGNADPALIGLIEALWRSRRHLDDAALALLETIAPGLPATHEVSSAVAEIVSRPIFGDALGAKEAAAAAARARQLRLPPLTDTVADYCALLRSGDLAGAAAAAQRTSHAWPQEPIFGLIGVWDAARRHDRVALASRAERLSIASRFQVLGLWPMREIALVTR